MQKMNRSHLHTLHKGWGSVKLQKNVYLFHCDCIVLIIWHKKLKNRTRKRVYGFYSLLKSQPSFLIGGEHWMRNRGIYLTAYKGRGAQRNKQNAVLNVDLFLNIFCLASLYLYIYDSRNSSRFSFKAGLLQEVWKNI